MRIACKAGAAGMALALCLGCGDSTGPGGSSAGAININAPGDVVEVDGTLQLSAAVTNQTGGVMASPVITWSSSNDAIASVSSSGVVTGRSAGQARIRARAGSVTDSLTVTVMPASCRVSEPRGTVAPGQSVSGTLAESGCRLPHGAPGDGWRLVLGTTTTLAINMTSTAYAAAIVVSDLNMNSITYNIASGPGSTARVLVRLPAGEYRIWATSVVVQSGAYQLTVETAQTGSCTTPRGVVTLGVTTSATLTETGSCLMENGRFADIWEFNASAPVTITADMMSAVMDTYLYLFSATGELITSDDDSGGNFNSRIVMTLPPGRYFFWASTFAPGTLGSYQLRVASGSPGGSGFSLRAGDKSAASWAELRGRQ